MFLGGNILTLIDRDDKGRGVSFTPLLFHFLVHLHFNLGNLLLATIVG